MQSHRMDIRTSHGVMAVEITAGDGPDVVFIHGNSSSRRVFHRQINDVALKKYRLISFDLPGHGESSNAFNKIRTYPLPGLAEATIELLQHIGANSAVLVGWSLGGHIAMEMLARSYAASGLFITGAPPVGSAITEGFRGNLMDGLASRGSMSVTDAAIFVRNVFGMSAEPFMNCAAMRTDCEFRGILSSGHRSEEKSNQRDVISHTMVKTAVVNGRDDHVVNLKYIDGVPYS